MIYNALPGFLHWYRQGHACLPLDSELSGNRTVSDLCPQYISTSGHLH